MRKILPILLCPSLFAITGEELARKVEHLTKPYNLKAHITMTLIDKKGRASQTTFKSITKDSGKKQMIWILSPAMDRGTSFLKIENDDGSDDLRMWLPAFKKIRRISAKKRTESFMNSDISYEDMYVRKIEDYNFEIVGEEVFNDEDCYLLESTAKNVSASQYSKHLSWISKSDYLPVKEISFDVNGNLLKEKEISYTRQKDYFIAEKIVVINVKSDHSTVVDMEKIQVNTEVPDHLFHERNLKRIYLN
tara:strand:+ start:4582 stop:5328 length:747 start_codon:yes stop_codon:yes gene_type:complete